MLPTKASAALGRILGFMLAVSVCISMVCAHPSSATSPEKVKRSLVGTLNEEENSTNRLEVTIKQGSDKSATIAVKVVNMNPYPITFWDLYTPFHISTMPECKRGENLQVIPHHTNKPIHYGCAFMKRKFTFTKAEASSSLVELQSEQPMEVTREFLRGEKQWAQFFEGLTQDAKNASSKPLEASATVYLSGNWEKVYPESKEEVLQRMFKPEWPEDKETSLPDGFFGGHYRANDLNVTVSLAAKKVQEDDGI